MDLKETQEKLCITTVKSKIVTSYSFNWKFWVSLTQDLGIYNDYKQEDPISIANLNFKSSYLMVYFFVTKSLSNSLYA